MLKGLIACGAVIVTLLAGLGWQTWQLSQERRESGATSERLETCRQATNANLANLRELESALDDCIGEETAIESDLAADGARRAHQVDTLRGEVAALQDALRTAAAGDDCAALLVPGDAAERLRDAADRAHRAGDQDGPSVGAGSG